MCFLLNSFQYFGILLCRKRLDEEFRMDLIGSWLETRDICLPSYNEPQT